MKQYSDALVAVVNNGSADIAVFVRVGNRLRIDKVVQTTSAPVSIDFGNDHLYVAGATTVDSSAIYHDNVAFRDGAAGFELATGGAPAHVDVIDGRACSSL